MAARSDRRLTGTKARRAIRRQMVRDGIAKGAVTVAGYGVGGLVAKKLGPKIAPKFAGLAKYGKAGEWAAGAAPGFLAKEAVEFSIGTPVVQRSVNENRRLAKRVGVKPEKVSRLRAQLPGYLPSFDVWRQHRKLRKPRRKG